MSELEVRIMEISQLEKKTERQMNWVRLKAGGERDDRG